MMLMKTPINRAPNVLSREGGALFMGMGMVPERG